MSETTRDLHVINFIPLSITFQSTQPIFSTLIFNISSGDWIFEMSSADWALSPLKPAQALAGAAPNALRTDGLDSAWAMWGCSCKEPLSVVASPLSPRAASGPRKQHSCLGTCKNKPVGNQMTPVLEMWGFVGQSCADTGQEIPVANPGFGLVVYFSKVNKPNTYVGLARNITNKNKKKNNGALHTKTVLTVVLARISRRLKHRLFFLNHN